MNLVDTNLKIAIENGTSSEQKYGAHHTANKILYILGWNLKFDPPSLSGHFHITLVQYRDTFAIT